MKFPEFDELGNMIGQGFDSGAQVLNNPGVQGLLAAGLGAASQVGKRNVGPLNTLGAAGLAGLGAYGLGRNVNSRNEYNKARIKQLQQEQDQKQAAVQLAATEKQGLKDYLRDQQILAAEGMGINNLRNELSTIQSNLPNIPNQVPFAPEQQPEYKDAQEKMRGLQSTVDDYDKRKLLSKFDSRNPVLKEQLQAIEKKNELTPDIKNWEYGKNHPNFPVGTSNMQDFAKYQHILETQGPEAADLFYKIVRKPTFADLGSYKGEIDKSGKGVKNKIPVELKPDQETSYIAKARAAETSATERTKNAENIVNEYALSGKGEMVAGNIKRLESAMEKLKNAPDLTGKKFELLPDAAVRAFYPEAWEAKQAVELVIQPTLKETLGAQMSEAEGERVFARTVALSLPPESNYRKWTLLLKQVKGMHDAKMAVVRHMYKHGNLDNFEGKLPSKADYTDEALGWDKLPGYKEAKNRMELTLKVGPGANKFSDKSKEERYQEFKRLNQ